jgi:hypothetical protein
MGPEHLWDIWWSAFVLAILSRVALIHRLKTNHNPIWESLGSPTLWNGNLTRARLEFLFLLRIDYWKTGDYLVRILSIAYSALYIVVVGLFVFLTATSLSRPRPG